MEWLDGGAGERSRLDVGLIFTARARSSVIHSSEETACPKTKEQKQGRSARLIPDAAGVGIWRDVAVLAGR
jgi:hypothetical protein